MHRVTSRGMLALADGSTFPGIAVGAPGIATGEVVFNTSMTGYQEIITDPSYRGQIVAMTAPHIGNYGTCEADAQAGRPWCSGLVTRSPARRASSWRSEASLTDWLIDRDVVAVGEIDTRRLTRHVRANGSMPAALGTDVSFGELIATAAAAPSLEGRDLTARVGTGTSYTVPASGTPRGRIVAVDFGIKRDIVAAITGRGLEVLVVPAATSAAEILGLDPTGVFLSNGPGDPEPLTTAIATVTGLLGNVPVFGICLGHQIMGLAVGARTYKLPFGHHGGNHPVRDLETGRIAVTAQNHGFAVDLWPLTGMVAPRRSGDLVGRELLPGPVETGFGTVVPTHQNLNDGTLEGMRFHDIPAFSVQFHPEAAPGPRDARHLFDRFVQLPGVRSR